MDPKIEELLGQYWDLAYREGKTGENLAEEANEVLWKLRELVDSKQGPPQKYDDTLIPFLALMRRELHANSGKGDRPGWRRMSPEAALLEIYHHTAKLAKAVKNNDGPAIEEYSADVANMAMMLLDVCDGLTPVVVSSASPAPAQEAQRVPDGWKQEAAEAIDWLLNNIRRDAPQLSGKAMGNAVRVRDALLASTPAPAQQEPVYCTYPACQSTGKTCLGACAKHAAQHQEPPQQERKPSAEQVLEKVLAIVRGYLPPDGMLASAAMSEIIALVDPWPFGDPKGPK